ncbi:MAG: hypothetical protein ABI806_08595, partial [Candidatus Solibacter sp.]
QGRYVSAGLLFLKPLGTFFTMLPKAISVNAFPASVNTFSSAFISLIFLRFRGIDPRIPCG